jgi:ATP-dependent protease HslVU (ClpYQ) peptidase subunit
VAANRNEVASSYCPDDEVRYGPRPMSVIVAVRKGTQITIAADTQDNFGDLRPPADNHEAIKLRPVGGAVLGASGWALYDDILEDYLERRPRVSLRNRKEVFSFFVQFWKDLKKHYPFVNDQPGKESDSPFANLDASFLVASPGGIFLVSSNMSVSDFRKYYAIGSGSDYALGAVHAVYDEVKNPETIAERAVLAAIAYDNSCGGRIVSHTIKALPKK